MDSSHSDVEKTEFISCNHLATANFVTPYSDNQDLSRGYQQPFNYTRPTSLHMPQVPSNPNVAQSCDEDQGSREHQQNASHTGPVCDGRQELHTPQVPSNPTSHSGNMHLSRRYHLPLNHTRAIPIHGGSHEKHQTYVPHILSNSTETHFDIVDLGGRDYRDSQIPLHVVRGQLHQELQPYTREYHSNETNDTTSRSNTTGLQSYAEYGSVMSSYPQCTTYNSEGNALETSKHDRQYYGRGATPYYSSQTLIQPHLIPGFMLFPSPANNLPRIESFRVPTSSIDQNKAEYQNWLVSETTPSFASQYHSNQTGAEYISNGTAMWSKPNLPMNQSDSKPANIPTISSVYSVQERYSISATHDNIKTSWSQCQPPPDINNTQQLNGNSHPDNIYKFIGMSQNTSVAAAYSSGVDTHQHQIEKVAVITIRNKDDVCRTLPEQEEVKGRKSTQTIEHNKLPNESSEVASCRQRLLSALQLKTMSELRRLCWNQGLKIAGRKQVLVDRILDPTQSSKSNDQTRLRTIHLWLKKIGATHLQSISRCLCSAIDKGFLNMMDLALADVIAKGECPHCSAYMEATVEIVLHQPDNPFGMQCVTDLLKCPNCRSIIYVGKMCLGAPVFTTPEKHNHCMMRSMFGGCVEKITN
ncbi:uncharacterized protein LOC117104666 [Anneissia japonica]|uniref:uncharacterized protein LOC117104666 n=1 Tax=Anneissia japonica TaxID=1529436 RepID=UPI0014255A39|nr:uncharacterized protein LOC117104666 [Anneissia japonica]